MFDLDDTIQQRRSVRGFFSDRPVPRELLAEALQLAQCAPSNCNVQPWRVFIASGVRRDQLQRALVEAVNQGQMPTPEDPPDAFPEPYRRLQVECAVSMYTEMGIDRHDKPGRQLAFLRNFELFDAPHVAIVCMEQQFGVGVALDVGMYVQTLMLALWARRVGSCAQASLRIYPEIVRRELEIADNLRIMCGISFGYEDESVSANRTRQSRNSIETNVTFLDA